MIERLCVTKVNQLFMDFGIYDASDIGSSALCSADSPAYIPLLTDVHASKFSNSTYFFIMVGDFKGDIGQYFAIYMPDVSTSGSSYFSVVTNLVVAF